MEHFTKAIQYLLLPLLLLAWLSSVADAADIFTSLALQRHMASGRLAGAVKERLDRDGHAELLVVLVDDDVQVQAGRLRQQLRTATDTDEIVREKDRLLNGKKGHLLAGLSSLDHAVITDYEHFPVIHLEANARAVAQLLDDPAVVSVQENRAHQHFLAQSLPLIGQPQVQTRGFTGSGTAVAVLDTGVDYTKSAFGSCTAPGVPVGCKVVFAQDFAPSDNKLDDNGHGTNVAGIVVGVAPDTKILALDVFRTDGYAYDSDILSALNWVLSNRSSYNIASLNMSLGGGQYFATCGSDQLAGAISNLRSAGVASAIASGNDAYTGSMASPGCVPAAVSVGAVYDSAQGTRAFSICTDSTTAADQVTCFTNMADFLTILAPGAMITAAGKTYAGTSQATPHVAGAVAVIKGAQPGLTVDDVVARLTSTGTMVSVTRQATSGPVTYQKPRLNLDAALMPHVTASPLTYDFGNIAINGVATKTFTVTSAGTSDLVLTNLSLGGADGDQFTLQGDSCSGKTLAPAVTCMVTVRHAALTSGIRSASLNIPSNDPATSTLTIPLAVVDGTFVALTLARNGTGSGSVTSLPTGIACGATCTGQFGQGTTVTLTPTPAADSYFAGWSGACSGTGPCQPVMNAAASVTATFTLLPPTRVSSISTTYYTSLMGAYAGAVDGDTLQLKSGTLVESLLFDREIGVTIQGGYDGAYGVMVGVTTVTGDLTISAGSVMVENLAVQ